MSNDRQAAYPPKCPAVGTQDQVQAWRSGNYDLHNENQALRLQIEATRPVVQAALTARNCCDKGEYGSRCTTCRALADAVTTYRKAHPDA